MRERRHEIEGAGAELVFIGNGSPEEARSFQVRHVPDLRVLTDPERRLYDELRLVRSASATLAPRSMLAAAGALLRGHRQTSLAGDPWQQGGLVVLGRDGEVLYLQRYRHPGDRPDFDRALRAIASAAARKTSRRRGSTPSTG